ncbi:MAG: hypothetical protein WBO37_11930 [Gammaproteobacteria bacterium]
MLASTSYAFDMGNMMNPSKWMGGNNDSDRYDDYDYDYGYGGPGYGYGGYPGYGYGGYGGPGYGYGGYGGPGYGYGGYGGPGYGYGGYPGYGATSTIVVPGGSSSDSEIEQLKDRIRQLEGEVR